MASMRVTLYSMALSIISLASHAFDARGFSQSTCLPLQIHVNACSQWQEFGVAMYTASILSLDAISSSEVNVYGMLCFAANSSALSCVREHTAVSSKRPSCLAPSITQSVMLLVPTTPNLTLSMMNVLNICSSESV